MISTVEMLESLHCVVSSSALLLTNGGIESLMSRGPRLTNVGGVILCFLGSTGGGGALCLGGVLLLPILVGFEVLGGGGGMLVW